MNNWLQEITDWFYALAKAIFTALLDFVHDGAVWVFDQASRAVVGALVAIPAPSFGSGGPFAFLNVLPDGPRYLIGQLHVEACFAVILVGITFRLVRLIVTLFQWN